MPRAVSELERASKTPASSAAIYAIVRRIPRGSVVTYGEVAHARQSLLRSIGTCSFEEPIAEIAALDFGLKGVDGV